MFWEIVNAQEVRSSGDDTSTVPRYAVKISPEERKLKQIRGGFAHHCPLLQYTKQRVVGFSRAGQLRAGRLPHGRPRAMFDQVRHQ